MSVQMLCLICDSKVDPERHGNLMQPESALRQRVEKVVRAAVGSSQRCVSLCLACEGSLDTIEEYYRQIECFRSTFNATLTKYGEILPAANVQGRLEEVSEGGMGSPSTWTICVQAGDGSLVPIQQGTPLVMADDHQVVLETVTVESSETPQVSTQEEVLPDDGTHGDYPDPEGPADDTILHPSILDHTGMALPTETPAEQTTAVVAEAAGEESTPLKPLFMCACCSTNFEQADDLIIHERIAGHGGSYNYKCGMCGNIYARIDSLRDHMCRHTGEKPHQCNICGEAFSFRNQLSRHRTAHYQNPSTSGVVRTVEKFSAENLTTFLQQSGGNKLSHVTVSPPVPVNGDENSKNMDGELNVVASTDDAEVSSSANNKDMVVLQKLLGTDGDLELVQSSSGEMRLVPKQVAPEKTLECPKCKEVFGTRHLLQRHQCPVLTLNSSSVAVSCPKCQATFIKRSLLERHRCPALLFSALTQNSQKAEPALDIQEISNNMEEPGNMDGGNNTQVSVASEITVTCKACKETFTSVENLQVHVELCEGVDKTIITEADESSKDCKEEGNLILSKETNDFATVLLSEQPEAEESALNKMNPEMIELHCQILDDSADISITDTSVVLQNTPSSIRKSVRAAGKVNPILERLKKKSKGALEDQEITRESGQDQTESERGQSITSPCSSTPVLKRKRGRPPKIRPQGSPGTPGEKIKVENVTPKRGRGRPRKRGPGRPRKYKIEESYDEESEEEVVESTSRVESSAEKIEQSRVLKKRRPGRPRKYKIVESYDEESDEELLESTSVVESSGEKIESGKKRGRGRPRKYKIVEAYDEESEEEGKKSTSTPEARSSGEKIEQNNVTHLGIVKRKRGRPRKVPLEISVAKETVNISEEKEISEEKVASPNNEGGNKESIGIQPEGAISNTQGTETVVVKRKRGRPRKRADSDQKEMGASGEVKIKEEEGEKENRASSSEPMGRKVEEEVDWIYNDRESGDQSEIEEGEIPIEDGQNIETFDIKVEDEPASRQNGRKKRSSFWCEKCDRHFSCLVALKKHKLTSIHKRGVNIPENRKYKCNICGRGFMKIDHLRDHRVNHTGEMQHQCFVCKKRFKFRSQLSLHRNTEHTESEVAEAMRLNPYVMRGRYRTSHRPPGEAQFDAKFQPEIMQSVEDKSTIFRCKVCMQGFMELRLFNRHIISHFPVKPFKCEICEREFARADTLRSHQKVHYGFVPDEHGTYLCDTCGRQFKKIEQLRNHVKMHLGQRSWKCEVCGKAFFDKYTLARHAVIHETQKPWLCATCGRGFNRRAHLEAHEAQHTGKNLYKCEICERGFSDQGNLGRHMLVHSQARPYACTVCGDTFKRKGNLDEHVLTHSTERQAVCDECGARFTTKRYLRIHQLIHSGDRPHKCVICNATFRQLSALITHKRIHSGDAPYKCTHCEKRFKYYDQWKAHEYGHTDAKPYKCMLCSATYRQAGSLRQHRKLVHGNQKGMVFLCTVCNKTFASTMSLEPHMKKIHGAEASLQSLQAIGHEAINTTTGSETANIVQITNPQGAIETIELANLPEDGGPNYVTLLSGQTLTNLQSDQVAMTSQGGVQLTDGQRIVQLVSSLDESGQVMEVSGENGQQVIHIDSIANIQNQDTVVSEPNTVLQYNPNIHQQTVVQITDGHTFVNSVPQIECSDSHTTQSITEALTSVAQVSTPTTEGQMQEVQTITVDQDGKTSYVVSIPQDLAPMTNIDHQMVSNGSLVPIEVVPIETTVTTLETSEHSELVTMETEHAEETIQHLDPGDTDVITETLTHELPEEEVVETVSIATTYDTVPDV